VGIDRFIKVDMERKGAGAARSFSATDVAARLGSIDCLISLVPWHSSSLGELAKLACPAWSIGLHTDFDFFVQGDSRGHSADRIFSVVEKFAPNLRMLDFARPPTLPLWSLAAAEDIRRAIGASRRLVVVHEETATEGKRWLPSRMNATLRALTAQHPDLFVVVLSRRPSPSQIESVGAGIEIARVSLPFFLAVIARADAFIGIDSVGLHAADLWGVPAVGLFGPTRPYEWGFRFSGKGIHVDGEGSTSNISVAQVVSAFNSLQFD
jgi:ADP-heptose:LPS heptosyltransferase